MSEPIWQYANAENSSVFREWPDGLFESKLIIAEEIQAWLAEGNTPNPYVPPPPAPEPTAEEKLAAAGLTVDDLKTLLGLN